MDRNYMKNKAFIWSIIIIAIVGYGVSKVGVIGVWGVAKLQDTLVWNASDINEIKANMTASDVEIEQYNGNEIKVEIYSNRDKNDLPTVEKNGNTLMVKESNETKASFGIILGSNKIKIYIPKGTVLDYNLNSSSGNIEVEMIHARKFNANSSSGDIEVEAIQTEEFSGKASSGNINVDEVNTSTMVLNSSSGNITVSGTITTLTTVASSGNIDFDHVISDLIQAKASSGNIKGEIETNTLDVSASSGNIEIEFNSMPKNTVVANANSGNITLELPNNDGFTLNYATSSGNVRNSFTGLRAEKPGIDIYEGGTVIIQATTTSGNIKIAD